jgi:hypothetical protein
MTAMFKAKMTSQEEALPASLIFIPHMRDLERPAGRLSAWIWSSRTPGSAGSRRDSQLRDVGRRRHLMPAARRLAARE